MKYSITDLNYNNFSVFEDNKLPKRSCFVPYSDRKALEASTVISRRRGSTMTTLLSGDDWGFKYFEKLSRLPEKIDTEYLSFDRISVPSDWQRTGYDRVQYINCSYAFPVNYPYVPEDMSAGVYFKKFSVRPETVHSIITFLGVANNLTLYVNGKYVGYSEGSHNMSEFLLDDFVNPGENELLIVMTKWCNGTYLECQDMFRENGIFRDVYLTEYESGNFIYDYSVETERVDDGYTLSVKANLFNSENRNISIGAELYDGSRLISSSFGNASAENLFSFGTLPVSEWSAEKPKLYTLYLTLLHSGRKQEIIRSEVGFRTVEISGELFLFNRRKIKFKGVNHHDTHPTGGYCLTAEELERDVRIIKEYNCNAVRTSHYPPDPVFLDLCDQYGLYVIDEADIETHGCAVDETKQRTPFSPPKINRLSNSKEWLPRYLDRVQSLYERDKNHACVTMWSLGNEAGGWKNQDACYEYLKSRSSLPVHYEGVIRTPRGSYDVVSEMYTHLPVLRRIASNSLSSRYNGKPFFLCEYCHAMGVGPGCLEEYWKLIYSTDKLCGGCIWEFADHAFYDENAHFKYTYGGDHGEDRHDGNFCVDGLFFPDRRPHTGAYEMKAVYRPIRVERVSDNIYSFKNTNSFTPAGEYDIVYELSKNGHFFDGSIVELELEPGETKQLIIPHKPTDDENDYAINFIVSKDGRLVSNEQIVISDALSFEPVNPGGTVAAVKRNGMLEVRFSGGRAVFDPSTGALAELYSGEKNLLFDPEGFVFNIFRAPIDNDMNIARGWRESGFDSAGFIPRKLTSVEAKKDGSEVRLKVDGEIVSAGKRLFGAAMTLRVFADGSIRVRSILSRKGFLLSKLELPRFGWTLKLDRTLQNIRYYGLGCVEDKACSESLTDFREHSAMGLYELTVDELEHPYIKPQENGVCSGVKELELTDESGCGLSVRFLSSPFFFSARNYSNETLRSATHREELKRARFVTLNVDGFMRGAGTNSCGPDTLDEHKVFIGNEIGFEVLLRPLSGDKNGQED